MDNVLVIGAGGQVGGDLVVKLLETKGSNLALADNRPPGAWSAREKLVRARGGDTSWEALYCELNVTDREGVRQLIAARRPQVIFHLAAILSGVGEKNPQLCFEVNMDGLRHVLDAVEALGSSSSYRPRVVWPSSIAAFGHPDRKPYDADDDGPFFPLSIYGVTKVAGERLGEYYALRRKTVDFRSLRFPGLLNNTPPGGGSSDYANALYEAGALGKPVDCFVDWDVRMPFMHTEDAVRALLELAQVDEGKLKRRTYNIAAFSPTAGEIRDSIKKQVPDFAPGLAIDSSRQANVLSWPQGLDDAPARADWGWQPKVQTLDQLTDRLLAEFRETALQVR